MTRRDDLESIRRRVARGVEDDVERRHGDRHDDQYRHQGPDDLEAGVAVGLQGLAVRTLAEDDGEDQRDREDGDKDAASQPPDEVVDILNALRVIGLWGERVWGSSFVPTKIK